MTGEVAAIAIGRNEGQRLKRCLTSLAGRVEPIVYVDSGSTDDSVAVARDAGVEVVELDMSLPFTAARARNAGLARLIEVEPHGEFVQFIDADCEMREGWVDIALKTIMGSEDIAVVCGRRRERFPDASIYNQIIDEEWDTPIGEARACGGDALMRRKTLYEVNGYRDDLIAGEEPEMCYRMRQKGWRILRIEAEMTWHDAAVIRFGQWWQRSRRAGHAFAEGAALHWAEPERFWVAETGRALFWGIGVPLAAGIGALIFTPWALSLLLALPAQVIRFRSRGMSWKQGLLLAFGKVPEASGVLDCWLRRMSGRRKMLIEYK